MDLTKILLLEEKWVANCTDEPIVFRVGDCLATVMPCGLGLPTTEERLEYLLTLPGSASFKLVYRPTSRGRLVIDVLTRLFQKTWSFWAIARRLRPTHRG